MRTHHRVALSLTALVAVAVVVDLVVILATGDRTVVTDDATASAAAGAAMSVAIAAPFAAGAVVLHRERDAFTGSGRALRAFRSIALGSLAALVVGMGVLHPVQLLADVESGALYDASEAVGGLALLGTSVSAIAIGLLGRRREELGIGGRALAMVIPVVVASIALGVAAPSVASPVFVTLTMMLGFGTVGAQPQRAAVPAVA